MNTKQVALNPRQLHLLQAGLGGLPILSKLILGRDPTEEQLNELKETGAALRAGTSAPGLELSEDEVKTLVIAVNFLNVGIQHGLMKDDIGILTDENLHGLYEKLKAGL